MKLFLVLIVNRVLGDARLLLMKRKASSETFSFNFAKRELFNGKTRRGIANDDYEATRID